MFVVLMHTHVRLYKKRLMRWMCLWFTSPSGPYSPTIINDETKINLSKNKNVFISAIINFVEPKNYNTDNYAVQLAVRVSEHNVWLFQFKHLYLLCILWILLCDWMCSKFKFSCKNAVFLIGFCIKISY